MKITAVDVMKPMLALLVMNILVLSIWTAVDPLQVKIEVVETDAFLRNIETYGVCSSDSSAIFISCLAVINLGSLLFSVFEAYRARHISTDFQESSYIFIAMALIFVVALLGIPVIVISRDNVAVSYFVTASLIFIICSTILLLIFAPKVNALRENNRRSTIAYTRSSATANTNLTTRYASSDLTADEEGIQITNLEQAKAELEQENRRLLQEVNRLEEKERKQAERLEKLANYIDGDSAICTSPSLPQA